MSIFKRFFSCNSSEKVKPVAHSGKPVLKTDLQNYVDEYSQGDGNSSDYVYRLETKNGWKKYFNNNFVITSRKANSRDLQASPEYATNLEKTGNDKAFYCYGNKKDAEDAINMRLNSLAESQSYCTHHGIYALAFVARFDKSCPALKGKSLFKDRSSNDGAMYILPEVDEIQDEHIHIYFAGHWLPKNNQTGTLLEQEFENSDYATFISKLRL
ncbi:MULTISPECIES: hypothetical protein [unclassified Vibrio]|uniref:hypothetical protein n=1 Tax=unclassified Vibrio TaxID=2614977 RepID=UPI00202B2242|nr:MULTISPECIES: hypothetical protein [unclassified Vibrio]MDW3169928.1 hypothetical protein [Vibrio sp. Y184]URQ95396.1 hypothetical protein J4N40_06325 [Vibrio sp. SCSIO 43097]